MVDPIDDIARQARQGSVSAIIQILNEKLADSGVRTRAILDNGVLQLLCEAPTPEQLEQSVLVERVRYILESIGPRNIRRININSRIVREQQLLWLQEIQRDPKGQLLWSEEITLARLNPFKRMVEDWKTDRLSEPTPLPKSERSIKEQQQFWRGMLVGGASLLLLLALVGWAIANWLGFRFPTLQTEANLQPSPTPAASPAAVPASPVATPAAATDPFVLAVRLAEQSVAEGQKAQNQADWLRIASQWQRASDLMGQVPATDSRAPTAQNRKMLYQKNSEAALKKAQEMRAPATPTN